MDLRWRPARFHGGKAMTPRSLPINGIRLAATVRRGWHFTADGDCIVREGHSEYCDADAASAQRLMQRGRIRSRLFSALTH